jgi:hypothetical protein
MDSTRQNIFLAVIAETSFDLEALTISYRRDVNREA